MCIFSNRTHIILTFSIKCCCEWNSPRIKCCALELLLYSPSSCAWLLLLLVLKMLKLLTVVISHKCHLKCLKNHIIKPLKRITIMAGNLYEIALNNFVVSCCFSTWICDAMPRPFSVVPSRPPCT